MKSAHGTSVWCFISHCCNYLVSFLPLKVSGSECLPRVVLKFNGKKSDYLLSDKMLKITQIATVSCAFTLSVVIIIFKCAFLNS